MAEVPHPREQHREIGLIGSGDDLLVADGTARLNDGGCSSFDGRQQTVGKGKKRVGRDG